MIIPVLRSGGCEIWLGGQHSQSFSDESGRHSIDIDEEGYPLTCHIANLGGNPSWVVLSMIVCV